MYDYDIAPFYFTTFLCMGVERIVNGADEYFLLAFQKSFMLCYFFDGQVMLNMAKNEHVGKKLRVGCLCEDF